MRRLICYLLSLWLGFAPALAGGILPFPGPGLPTGTPVITTPVSLGSAISSAATRSTWTLTTTAAIPGGSLVVIGIQAQKSSAISISSVSDGTNTYTRAVGNAWEVGTALVTDLWYKENATAVGSGATITATFSVATDANPSIINAAYVTGTIASSSLDKSNSGLTNGATAYASGTTGTLTQANEVAFGFMGDYTGTSNPTVTEGSGFTNVNTTSQGSGNFFNSRLSYQIVAATTALNYQPSTSVNSFGKALIATFKGF